MARLPNRAIIGPYKIADQITGDGETRGSSGQFGMVYFAKPVRGLGQPVAIKEFFPTNLVRRGRGNAVQPHDNASRKLFETGKAEFEREAEIVDALNHPNIVKILGFVEKNGTAYIISEWLDENLSEKVGKRGSEKFSPFSVDKMRPFLDQLLDGLERIHSASVLHRDIKPGNIMFRDKDTPVFIDFGAARQFTAAATQQLTAILTPGYAPYEQYVLSDDELGDEFADLTPEMIANLPKQGPWSDIYALAATCHFALTGDTPGNALMRKYHGRSYRPLETRVAGEPTSEAERTEWRHFLRQIDRALQVEPRNRFQSAREWRDAIENVGIDTTPPPPPVPPPPPPPGDKALPWIVGGLLAAGAVAGIVASNQPTRYAENTADVVNEYAADNASEEMTNVVVTAENVSMETNVTDPLIDNSSAPGLVDQANVTEPPVQIPTPTPTPTPTRTPSLTHHVYIRNKCGSSYNYYIQYKGSDGDTYGVGPKAIAGNTNGFISNDDVSIWSISSVVQIYAYTDDRQNTMSGNNEFWFTSDPSVKFPARDYYMSVDSDGDYNIFFYC